MTRRDTAIKEHCLPAWLDWLERYRYWIFTLIGLIYLAGFNGRFQLSSDAALYAEVGRNLANGNGYTYHGMHETLLYPGLPLLHALSRTISPSHHEAISQAILLTLGLATLALTYRLLLIYVPRRLALLGLVLTAVSFNVYEYSFSLMTDMPFTFGVTAAMLGYALLLVPNPAVAQSVPQGGRAYRHNALAWGMLGLGLSVAIIMRPMMLALVIAIGLGSAFHLCFGKQRVRAALVLILTLCLLLAFYLLDPRQSSAESLHYESTLALRAASPDQTLERIWFVTLPPLYQYVFAEAVFAVDMRMPANLATTILALVFMVVGCWRRWIWVVFIFFNLAAMLILSADVPRYLLPMTPIFMLGAAITYCHLQISLPRPWNQRVSIAVLALLVGMNAAKVSKFVWVQHQKPFLAHLKDGKFLPRHEAAQAIKRHATDADVVIAANYRELTYISGRTVVDRNLRDKLRTAAVVDDRMSRDDASFFLVEQDGIDSPSRYLNYQLRLGPVLAESAKDARGPDVWRLREVTLISRPNRPEDRDED